MKKIIFIVFAIFVVQLPGCSKSPRFEMESSLLAFFELVVNKDYELAYGMTSDYFKESLSFEDFKKEMEIHVRGGVLFNKYEILTLSRIEKTSSVKDVLSKSYYYVYTLKHFSSDGKLYKAIYDVNYSNNEYLIDSISPPIESTESLKYRYGDVNFPPMKGELFAKRVKDKMDKARESLKQ